MNYFALLISYLVGSLSFAVIVSKFYKIADPREYGSKNAGATNVMRSGNKKAALFTLIGDFLKGLIIVVGSRLYFHNDVNYEINVAFCTIMVVIGHIYPIFFAFKGGKGVATSLGVILGLSWVLALIVFLIWLLIFKITKISSLSAILSVIAAPILAYVIFGNTTYFGTVLIVCVFVLYRHKGNIYRIVTGQEHSFKKN